MKQSKNLSSLSNHHQSEINRFKIWMIQKRYSKNTIKTYIHMIELFYIKNHEIAFDISKIERPIKARSLPKVITKEDIQFMLEGMHNLKHKTALSMLYGLGLRKKWIIKATHSGYWFKANVNLHFKRKRESGQEFTIIVYVAWTLPALL